MDKKSREQRIKEIEETEKILRKVMDGEKVACPKCGEILVFYGSESGKHPGVFCPSKDFELYMEFKNKLWDKL